MGAHGFLTIQRLGRSRLGPHSIGGGEPIPINLGPILGLRHDEA